MPQTTAAPPQGALIPNGRQQFFDGSGLPLANGFVTMYVAGTTVLATTWQDALLTTPNTNPIVLDSAGRATIWGLGNYTQVVQDSALNQIWSQEVAGPISSLALTDTGTTNTLVASVPGLVTSGLTNPLAQITGIMLQVIAANSNTGPVTLNLNGLGPLALTYPGGSALTGGEVPAGAYTPILYNPTSNTFQLAFSKAATVAGLPGEIKAFGGATVPTGWALCYGQVVSRSTYPNTFAAFGSTWGAGDGSTTFALPDLRGSFLAGVDAMGGTAAGRLTSLSLGGSTSATLGVVSGSELTQSHNHAVTQTPHSHTETSVQTVRAAGTGNYWAVLCDGTLASSGGAGGNPGNPGTAGIATATVGLTLATYGAGGNQNVPPVAIVNYITPLS